MKKKVNRDALVLSILTFLTALTWIAYDVYRSLTQYTIPDVLEEQMKRLEPKIDRTKIEKLKQRFTIPEEELDKVTVIEMKGVSPTAALAEMPESTVSAEAEE